MSETFEGYDKFIRHFLYSLLAVGTLCLIVMLIFAYNKVVVVSAEDAGILVEEQTEEEAVQERIVAIPLASTEDSGVITITCPPGVVGKDVSVSKRPDLKKVSFIFYDNNFEYLSNAHPTGDFSKVSSAYVTNAGDRIILDFELKDMYNPVVSYENSVITFSLAKYEKKNVVVVDPFFGGQYTGMAVGNLFEKDINLKIAEKIEKLSENKDYNVYLTRTADATLNIEERLEIIELLKAQYYVGISLDGDAEDSKNFGMSGIYNSEFYRNGMENVDFADIILKSVVNATSNRALNLKKSSSEDIILTALEIPAMTLKAGMLTNSKEAMLLDSDEYIEKIALGVIEALDSVVE